MPSSQQEPYWSSALKKLPKNSKLMSAVAEYLGMRLSKNPSLSVAEWNACIDELVNAYDIQEVYLKESKVRRIGRKEMITIPDLCYLFSVATSRKWNHVFFTHEQDRLYNNISFYQDPYWHDTTMNEETRRILQEELDGTGE